MNAPTQYEITFVESVVYRCDVEAENEEVAAEFVEKYKCGTNLMRYPVQSGTAVILGIEAKRAKRSGK